MAPRDGDDAAAPSAASKLVPVPDPDDSAATVIELAPLLVQNRTPRQVPALTVAAVARRLGVGVTMVGVEARARFPSVVDVVPEAQREVASPFDAIVEADAARAAAAKVPFEAKILAGEPIERIVDLVESGGYDLLVVGHLGHSALVERFVGSVATSLIARAPCAVMVVK